MLFSLLVVDELPDDCVLYELTDAQPGVSDKRSIPKRYIGLHPPNEEQSVAVTSPDIVANWQPPEPLVARPKSER